MDAEEKLVLNHIRDAGNMGACLFRDLPERPYLDADSERPARHRNLESDADDQDGLASRDDCQGAQGPRREKDHQDGQVGQGESSTTECSPQLVLPETDQRSRRQAAPARALADTPTLRAPACTQTPTRKIYMLTGIAPSVELTGGPWFTDNELDVELVETLKKVVRKFLQQKVRAPFSARACDSFLSRSLTPGLPRTQSQPPSVTVTDPSTSESTRIKPIYPVTATPLLPTSEQVLEWILKSGAAIVDLNKEHVEDLLDLMVFDGDVEKVLVNRLGPDGMPVAARKGGKANGKKAAKSSSSKRKKGAESSSSDEDSDGSDTGGGKGKKGKGGKRAANGKAKRKRAKLGSDTETESDDDQSSDFDSDAAAPSAAKKGKGKRRRAGKGSEDDDEEEEEASGDSDGGRKKKGSSKRRKKRVKRRVKAEGDSDQGASSSESEDESASRRKRGAAVEEADDAAAEGGAGTDGGNTQYVYRMIRQYRPTVGWTDMPCGRCPVEEFCSEPPRRRAEAVRRPAQVSTGAPSTRIEFEGGIQGIGMLGGAGAAIGVSDAKWGELKGGIGNGVAPVNPVDCPAYKAWLDF